MNWEQIPCQAVVVLLISLFIYLFIYVLSKDSIICWVYKLSSDGKISERKLVSVWKEVTVAYFEVPSQYLPGWTEESHGKNPLKTFYVPAYIPIGHLSNKRHNVYVLSHFSLSESPCVYEPLFSTSNSRSYIRVLPDYNSEFLPHEPV